MIQYVQLWTSRIQRFFSISWFKTLVFNLSYLPLKKAFKLPVLLYNVRLSGSGKYIFDIPTERIKFGMIKLGINYEPACYSRQPFVINNGGCIIFHGSVLAGNSSNITIHEGGSLSLGKNCDINAFARIVCHNKIEIDDFCSIGWNVSIMDTDFHEFRTSPDECYREVSKPIHIHSNAWICTGCTILKGSSIPEGCTLATNSTLNRRIISDTYTLVAGTPAKALQTHIYRKDKEDVKSYINWNLTSGIRVYGLKSN